MLDDDVDVGVPDDDSGDAAGDGQEAGGLSLLVDMAPTCAGPLMWGDDRLSPIPLLRYVVLEETGDSCEAATTFVC